MLRDVPVLPEVGQKLRDRGGQLRAVVGTHGADHRRGRRKCQLCSGSAVGTPAVDRLGARGRPSAATVRQRPAAWMRSTARCSRPAL